jgi:hypothetical protein
LRRRVARVAETRQRGGRPWGRAVPPDIGRPRRPREASVGGGPPAAPRVALRVDERPWSLPQSTIRRVGFRCTAGRCSDPWARRPLPRSTQGSEARSSPAGEPRSSAASGGSPRPVLALQERTGSGARFRPTNSGTTSPPSSSTPGRRAATASSASWHPAAGRRGARPSRPRLPGPAQAEQRSDHRRIAHAPSSPLHARIVSSTRSAPSNGMSYRCAMPRSHSRYHSDAGSYMLPVAQVLERPPRLPARRVRRSLLQAPRVRPLARETGPSAASRRPSCPGPKDAEPHRGPEVLLPDLHREAAPRVRRPNLGGVVHDGEPLVPGREVLDTPDHLPIGP